MRKWTREIIRSTIFLLFLFTAVTFSVGGVLADDLILDNGDQMTGSFVQFEGGTLVFDTGYAGKITIQADQIRHLVTQAPVFVTFSDGSTVEETAFFSGLKAGDGTAPTGIDMAAVESIYPSPKPPIRYTLRANVGITNERGNSDTDQYRVDAKGVARTEKQRYTLGGEFNREKASDELTVSNWKAYGRYDYFLSEKWFLNGNALFENDEFADLELRSTLGAGVGHQIFESADLNLSASAGLAYIDTDFIVAEDRDFPAVQWLVNYDQFIFNQFVQLFHSDNGYISLENGNDWIIYTRQGLRFPLVKGFVTTLQYNYDYQNIPSADAKSKWSSTFLFLLGYQFGN